MAVDQVTAGSKAALGGAKDGDYILMINDTPTDDLKHHDAQSMIRNTGQSLRLTLTRYAIIVYRQCYSVCPTWQCVN